MLKVFSVVLFLVTVVPRHFLPAATSTTLAHHDGSLEGAGAVQTPTGSNDYFAVRFAIPDEVILPYTITQVRFHNNDSGTTWPVVMVTHGSGNNPDLNNPVYSQNNVTGPDSDWKALSPGVVVNTTDDIFLVIKFPAGEDFGVQTGPGIGQDIEKSQGYQTGNLFSLDGNNFSEIGTNNLGMEVTIEYNDTVPVELTSFTAASDGRYVRLNWRTASETNNFGFDIERAPTLAHFTKIGFVHGQGTTTVPHEYAFVDSTVGPGSHFYRLRQIDLDGTFEYSPLVKVSVASPSGFGLRQNFPNPFNPSTNIRYEIAESAHVRLAIYNILGQLTRLLVDGVQPSGFHSTIWDGRDTAGAEVPGGIYLYRIEAGTFSQVRKLTLLR